MSGQQKEAREMIRERSSTASSRSGISEVVLTEQPFRDTDQTVGQLITSAIATVGENIRVPPLRALRGRARNC